MNLQLENKRALVTGSTAGIGYAIAERLLQEGASVIVNGRTQKRVETAMESLGRKFPAENIQGFAGDLSRTEIQKIMFKEFPTVEILVNNLGIFESKNLSELEESDWRRMFEINALSGALLSQHYLKEMREKNWGRILFIASETAVNIPTDMIHYGVSKAAQIAIARGLAETTKGTEITVNSILPGPTLSEGVTDYLNSVMKSHSGSREELQKGFIQSLRPTSLIQRFAAPEEVANLVAYLASPLASATNGASVRVEGGILRNVG
jgi:NAD(P)-dependent dehydrogenase (short-subunit alcohol dehydrogenase family)